MNFESNNDILKALGIESSSPQGEQFAPTVPSHQFDSSNGIQDNAKHFSGLSSKIEVRDIDKPMDTELSPKDFDDFHGAIPPQFFLKKEKPEHRMLILLKAKGMSNVEIARETGYTTVLLSNLFRQPWARKRLSEIIDKAGGNVVTTILESAAADSVYKLIELRDNEKVQPSVQRAACVDLLDRFLGKPTQQVDVRHEEVSSNDIGELNKKIEVLEKEENRLLGLSQ